MMKPKPQDDLGSEYVFKKLGKSLVANEHIKAGEVIAEIETDKATMEVEAVDDEPYVRHMEESGRISSEITRVPPGKMTAVKKFHRPAALRDMPDARRQQFLQEKQDIRRRSAQAMIKRGDPRGISLWWSIGQAIQELRRTKRAPHEPLN
jgi:hypothetical protein